LLAESRGPFLCRPFLPARVVAPTLLLRTLLLLLLSMGCFRPAPLTAAQITKDSTGTDLSLSSSWVGGVVPTGVDLAIFDATISGGTAFTLGGSLSLSGLQLTNPGGPVALSTDSFTLTLGSGGLDLGSARQNLTLTGFLTLGSGQSWNVNQGRTLNVVSNVSGAASSGLWKTGQGTAILAGNNTIAGQVAVTGGELVLTNGSALGTSAAPLLVGGDSVIGGGALVLAAPAGAGFTLQRNLVLSGYGNSSVPATQGSGMHLAQAALLNVGHNTVSGSISLSSVSTTRLYSNSGQLTLAGSLNIGNGAGVYFTTGASSPILPNNTVVSGMVTGGSTASILYKSGFGTLAFKNGASNFTGIVQVDGGIVRAENGSQLGTSTASNAVYLNGGTFEIRTDQAETAFATKNIAQFFSSTLFAGRALDGSGLNQNVVLGTFTPNRTAETLTINSRDGYGISVGTAGAITIPWTGGYAFTSNANGLFTINSTIQSTEGFPRTINLTATGDILVTGNLNGNSGYAHNAQKSGTGQLMIAGTAGTMVASFNANAGTTVVNSFGAFNNGNSGALNLGTTTTPGAVLYRGAEEITPKVVNLSGTTANAVLLSSGSGPLVLSRGIAATGAGSKNLVLGGTSTAANEIRGVLQDNSATNRTSLLKQGLGIWIYAPEVAQYAAATTATLPSGNPNYTNRLVPSSTAGLVVGQTVSGTNVSGVITSISGGTIWLSNSIGATSLAVGATLTFGTISGFTGNVTVTGGTLQFRPTAASGNGSDLLAASATLSFAADSLTSAATAANTSSAGGTFLYAGTSGLTETTGTLTLSAGAGVLRVTGDGTLAFGTLGATANGTGLNFDLSGAGSNITLAGTSNLSSGLLNPRFYRNGADFAALDGAGNIVSSTYTAAGGSLLAGNTSPYFIDAYFTQADAVSIAGGLKLASSGTLTLGGLLTINSGSNTAGAILLTGGNSAFLSGGSLTTGGAGDFVFRTDTELDVLTLASPLTATTTGGLTKNGLGILILSGVNAQTGTVTVNEGTLRLAAGAVLGAANQALTIRQGGVFDLGGVSVPLAVGSFNGSGTVTNSGTSVATLTIGNNNTAGVFSGLLQDGSAPLALTKAGTNAFTALTGLNTFTGPLTLSGGLLQVNTLADIGTASSIGRGDSNSNAASLVFNGGGLQYTGSNAQIYQATQTPSISINRLFTLAGNGTLDSSGQYGNNILATGAANNATLIFNNPAPVAFSGTGPRTLTLQGSSAGNNELDLQLVNNGTSALSVTKTGAGVWILGGSSNTYSGTTTISAGVLRLAPGTKLSPYTNLLFNSTGGVLEASGTFNLSVGAAADQVQWGANSVGGFAAAGAKLVVNGGTVTWGGTGLVSGTLLLNNAISALSEVEFASAINLGTNFTTSRIIQVDDNTAATTDFASVSGVISGSASAGTVALTKTGAGVLYLTGNNTFTGGSGGLLINNGLVVVSSLGANGPLGALNGTGDRLVIGAGTNAAGLVYAGIGETVARRIGIAGTGGNAILENNGAGALSIENMEFNQTGLKTLLLQGGNSDWNEIRASIGGGSLTALTKTGNGTWVLSGANNYSGATNIFGGVLGIANDAAFGSSTVSLNNTAPMSFVPLGGTRTLTNNFSTVSGALLTVSGTSSLVLTGTFNNRGVTLSNFLSEGAILTLAGTVTMQDTTYAKTLLLRGTGTTVLNGTLLNGGSDIGTLQVDMAPNSTFNAPPGLVILGENSTANTFVGNTSLTSGVLQLNTPQGSYLSGSTPLGVSTNALAFGGSGYFQTLNPLNLSQSVVLNSASASTAVFQGLSDITFAGTASSNSASNNILLNNGAGRITLAGDFTLQDGTNARTVTFGGSGDLFVNGSMKNVGGGIGSLIKTGPGTLTLAGTNTFNGALSVNGGTLAAAFNTAANNQLGATALTLGGGVLSATKSDATTSNQTYTSTTFTAATASALTLSTTGGGSLSLFTGLITRNQGATAVFTPPSLGAINVGTSNIGNWALVNTSAGLFFATKDASNNLAAAPTTARDAAGSFTDVDHVTDASGFTGTAGTGSIQSLRFNANTASTLAIAPGATLTLAGGGILVTPNVGAFDSTISGGVLASSAGEFFVFQQNPQPGNTLTLTSLLQSGTLTKAGPGTLILSSSNNTYTGATNLTAGTLRVSGGNAIGDRSTLNIANNASAVFDLNNGSETVGSLAGGGLLRSTITAGIVTGTVAVGGEVRIGSGTLTLTQTANTIYSGAITGTGSMVVLGIAAANTLTLNTASNPFSGSLVVNGAQLALANGPLTAGLASANLAAVSAVSILNGGGLNIDTTGALQADRLSDTAPILMRNTGPVNGINTVGLGFTSDQASTLAPRVETLGAVTLGGGANTIRVNANAALVVAQLSLDSLIRTNNATAVLLGSFMEDPVSPRRGDIVVRNGADLQNALVGGGGTPGSASISILPWAVGTNAGAAVTGAVYGNSFVTYSGASKTFRALATSEYEALTAGGGTSALNNVRYAGSSDLTLSGAPHSMNALLVENTSTTTALTLSGAGAGDSLSLASGALLFTGSATPQGITLAGFGGGITNPLGEYVITQNNTAAAGVVIASDLASPGNLTKAGPGTLRLSGTSSGLTGSVFLNQGVLALSSLNSVNSRPFVFAGGSLGLYLDGTPGAGVESLSMGNVPLAGDVSLALDRAGLGTPVGALFQQSVNKTIRVDGSVTNIAGRLFTVANANGYGLDLGAPLTLPGGSAPTFVVNAASDSTRVQGLTSGWRAFGRHCGRHGPHQVGAWDIGALQHGQQFFRHPRQFKTASSPPRRRRTRGSQQHGAAQPRRGPHGDTSGSPTDTTLDGSRLPGFALAA
jgi:autotransporter-associated beta strand protein